MIGDGEAVNFRSALEAFGACASRGKHFANGAAAARSVALRIRRRPLPALHG